MSSSKKRSLLAARGDAAAKMQEVQEEIRITNQKISAVEGAIESVQSEIRTAETKMELCAESDRQYWRDKEMALRDEESKLMDKEKALRDMESKLMDMENMLMDKEKALLSSKLARHGVRVEESLATVFERLKRDMPTPSSFSKDRDKGSWVSFLQKHPNRIICHRTVAEEASVPVCLLHPVFAQFMSDLESISVSPDDCVFVEQLMESMCGAFNNERNRMEAFIEEFQEYTKWKLNVIRYETSETDGSFTYGSGALSCNLEVKVEKGSGGGDPYMQGIAHYIKSLPENAVKIQYPCFLLELCGTSFSVNGIVNTDTQVICDTLSPAYQLLHNQTFSTSLTIAKLFASLRKALQALRSADPDGLSKASPFPFVTSFRDQVSNVERRFEFEEKLKGLLYSAKLNSSETALIVKFCSRYNADVHRYCNSHGFAPALFSIEKVADYFVIAMERLNLRPLSQGDAHDNAIISQAKFILEKLKEKHYVHGDMREANLQIECATNRLVLIDFDWAGIHGVDVYPPFMNPEIPWPEGAATGNPLLHEHDVSWFRRLFPND